MYERSAIAAKQSSLLLAAIVWVACAGCGGALVEPGHRALYFDPRNGGVQREVLPPGWYRTACPFWLPSSKCPHVDDFDVTYSTRAEPMQVMSAEGLPIEVKLSVIYRPILSELYQLDTEIGRDYYDEIVGPESRSAGRAFFARHSYAELVKASERLDDEIEADVRVRVRGRHVEIAGVTFESIRLPPELANAIRDRQTAEQRALKERAEHEREVAREKLEADEKWQKEKLELERNVERRRLEREAETAR